METTPFASEFTATEVAHKHPRSRPGFATKWNEIHLVLVQSLLLYFRRTRLLNFTHTDSCINSFCFCFTKVMNWTNTTWSSSVSIRFLQQPTKEKHALEQQQQQQRTCEKQQHWTTRKSTQVWWSRIGHIIRMKSLDTCVCVCARACIYQMHERNATKRKKTAEKNLQEQSVRKKKKRKEISEREISEREIHFTIHIRERRSTQAVWWHGRMRYRNWRDPARSSFLQTPRISPEGRPWNVGNDDHEKNNKEPRHAWAVR